MTVAEGFDMQHRAFGIAKAFNAGVVSWPALYIIWQFEQSTVNGHDH